MSAKAHNRRTVIVRRVEDAGVVRVNELAEEFGVSVMTVRRDLDLLAADRLVIRVRGGAARTRTPAEPASSAGALHAALSIGIVLPSADYVYRPIIAGMDQTLTAVGARSRLQVANYTPTLERELVQELLEGGVDGLVFGPTLDEEKPDQAYLSWIAELPVPVVLVERRLPDNWPGRSVSSVRTSFARGLTRAVAHLTELGHRRIAFFGHVVRMAVPALERQWADIVSGFEIDGANSPFLVDKDFRHWKSSEEPQRVLTKVRDAGVTALICRDDPVALTMVHHAQRTGLRIPTDLSVMTYDDEMATMCDPALSAISPPKSHLGRTAAAMLLEQIHDRRHGSDSPAGHVELEPALVVRDSTAPPGQP